MIGQHGIKLIKPIFPNNSGNLALFYKIKLSQGISKDALKTNIKSLKNVKHVWTNRIGKFDGNPNDTYFNVQWALRKIKAVQGWKITSGSPSIIVGVIDSGIDLGSGWNSPHSDFSGHLWNENSLYGYNVLSPYDPPYDDNTDGHGTRVAGIIGAATNNSNGIAGLAGGGYNSESGIKIMAVKISDGILDESNAAAGIVYAVDNGAKVINMSFGFGERYYCPGKEDEDDQTESFTALEAAIQYAYSNGVVMVAAAGNDGQDLTPLPDPCSANTSVIRTYPAEYTQYGVISVAATDSNDHKADYSNYASWVTVSAPGGQSGVDPGIYSTLPYNTYSYSGGTSFAAPQVAALAGLLLSYNSSLTPSQIKDIISTKSDDISSQNQYEDWQYKIGGRINVAKCLEYLAPPSQPENLGYSVINTHPRLTWTANTEYDLVRYDIYRDLGEGYYLINSVNQPATSYDDYDVYIDGTNQWSPTVYYYIKAVDNQSMASASSNTIDFHYTGLQKDGKEASKFESKPTLFSVEQNFPNPFNPTTKISYQIPTDEFVKIIVSDIMGREIKTLVNEYKSTGYYSVDFDASKLSSGMYFYSIQAGNYKATKKMAFSK